MKHRKTARVLGRTSAQRLALLRSLARALFRYERITTTVARAKELKNFAEPIITQAKRGSDQLRLRRLRQHFDLETAKKILSLAKEELRQRNGGYTRIIKIGPRKTDSAQMAEISLLKQQAQQHDNKDDKTSKKDL